MNLRLVSGNNLPVDATPPSPQESRKTYSVDQDGKDTSIILVEGDGGEHHTFEEAKEFAIFCLEETISECQERLSQLDSAETFQDYYDKMYGFRKS